MDAAIPLVKEALQIRPNLSACSFDRGFHSPDNQAQLKQLLKRVTPPFTGIGTKETRARAMAPDCRTARKAHLEVDSAIHVLDRVRNKAKEGIERKVAIWILAFNVNKLGSLLRSQTHRKRLKLAA